MARGSTQASSLALITACTLFVSATAAMAYRDDDDESLNLICYGEGEKPSAETHYGYEWDHHLHRYVGRSRTEMGTREFETSVTLQFFGDEGRIRLPHKLIPPIHSGGENQWWELHDVEITNDDIRAYYKMNGLNKPKVHINRVTGRIKINGIEDFSGRCEAIDPGSRRF